MAKYTDFYVTFVVHPVTGDLARLTDNAAISQSIKNIVFTDRYERPYNPTFGAGIPQTLFDNMVSDTEYVLQTKIREAINKFEPRATKVVVAVTTTPDRNSYTASIQYTPINTTTAIMIDAIFKRIR